MGIKGVCGVLVVIILGSTDVIWRWQGNLGPVIMLHLWGVVFPGGSDGKESTSNVGNLRSTPALGRSRGGGNGYPPQYSCLENSMDRGAWQAAVHGVTKSQTWLSDWPTPPTTPTKKPKWNMGMHSQFILFISSVFFFFFPHQWGNPWYLTSDNIWRVFETY